MMLTERESIVCAQCGYRVLRDDWPAHRCLQAKPRLPVAGFLVRLEGGRVSVQTLGPGPFGCVWLAATVYVDVSFAKEDLGTFVAHLLRSIEEQGE